MQYVIRGVFKSQDVYFIKFLNQKLWGSDFEVRHCSETIEGARFFTDEELKEAEDICLHLQNDNFKIYPVCPICHKEYEEKPAISRQDNKTKICGLCGMLEALEQFKQYTELKTPNN